MVEAAQNAAAEADLILWTEDVTAAAADRKHHVESRLFPPNRPVILVLNKIDRVSSEQVLAALSDWAEVYDFTAQVPVSALAGTNLDRLISVMESNLAEGPPFFPEDTVTDQPMRFIAAELIREKLFRLTGKEIPYAAAVTVETFSEDPDRGLASIRAVIHLERESQKGIVIGKAGGMLKKIGQAARHELEEMMECKVYLELFVRVEKNWSKDENALSRLGYR
jgi:GTP-binding protein Era